MSLRILTLCTLISLSGFSQSKKWVKLFDGKSFTNWHIYNHAGEAIPSKWKIEDGAMVFDTKGKSDWKINDLVD
jgi:hypothetical protein